MVKTLGTGTGRVKTFVPSMNKENSRASKIIFELLRAIGEVFIPVLLDQPPQLVILILKGTKSKLKCW